MIFLEEMIFLKIVQKKNQSVIKKILNYYTVIFKLIK